VDGDASAAAAVAAALQDVAAPWTSDIPFPAAELAALWVTDMA
jgi:hypothetical protein